MSLPLLSICMPAYKADQFLEPTLETIARQTYQSWELIVVEDGSHDRAEEMVAALAARVSQPVRFVRQEVNQGLPATRNTGIALAQGEWIVLLDSDDLWEPSHLADLVETAQRQPCDLVHSGSILFESDTGRQIEVRAPSAEITRDFPLSLFVADYVIQPSSVMLKKELWTRVGGFAPAFRYVEDREMWMRCARAGAVFAYTGRNTCLYRRHRTALSTHSAEMALAAAEVFEQHLAWEAIPRVTRRKYAAEAWAAVGRILQRRQPTRASRHFARACAIEWRADWWLRQIGCRIYGMLRPQ